MGTSLAHHAVLGDCVVGALGMCTRLYVCLFMDVSVASWPSLSFFQGSDQSCLIFVQSSSVTAL